VMKGEWTLYQADW